MEYEALATQIIWYRGKSEGAIRLDLIVCVQTNIFWIHGSANGPMYGVSFAHLRPIGMCPTTLPLYAWRQR